MKIMAVDYGQVRTGVAFSDPLGMIAASSLVVTERDANDLAQKLAELAVQNAAERIVVGNPKNMDGTEGFRSEASRAFAEILRSLVGVEVIMWDERRTTVDAARILHESGKRAKDQKKNIDAVAASIILQSYLDFIR